MEFESRFRTVNDYAFLNGFKAAFPNFHQADYGKGVVFGVNFLKDHALEWRDISASELGNPQTPDERFRAVNDYAFKNGFGGAFPNFHQADHGNGVVYGVQFLKRDAVEWRDVPISDLGNPQTMEDRFRAVADYANQHGFGAAFPNFHQADHGNGVVYGVIFIKSDAMEWRDVFKSALEAVQAKQTVRLHNKILQQPNLTIDEMVASMRTVYATAGLRVEVMSTENLDLPLLMDLDVECVRGSASDEQDELFSHRNHVGENELPVYFVRSTNPPLNGCASHPDGRPGAVVTRVASVWTLGHEIGHVLNLNHVNDSDQLMFGGGTHNITNPPPDLITSEINTMIDSPYTM